MTSLIQEMKFYEVMHVTSFSSILYWSNNECGPQKRQSGKIHSIILDVYCCDHCPAPFLLCTAKGVFPPVTPYCGYFIPSQFHFYRVCLPCFILLTGLISVYLSPVKYCHVIILHFSKFIYLTLLCLSAFLFGKQDWVKTEFQTKIRSLSKS